MSYPHEQEVRRLIEDMHRWSPGGGGGGGQWAAAVDSSGYRIAPVPIMGGEAADTQAALKRMDQRERAALEAFHIGRGHFKDKAAALGVSKSTYHRLLEAAHLHFYEIRRAYVAACAEASKRNQHLAKAGGRTARRASIGAGLSIWVGKVMKP